MLKINLGCGANVLPAPWVNCDLYAHLPEVDEIFDFGLDPWPFDDGSADEIAAAHCLEHSMGLLHVMQEAYRVLAPGGLFTIVVPEVRSLYFVGDPTHVMPITPHTIALFSKAWCLRCQAEGAANTPLALRLDVDFRVVRSEYKISDYWRHRLLDENMKPKDQDEFDFVVRSYNNVIDSLTFILERV